MSITAQRLGFCAVCGDRVHTDEKYLKTMDGYCHKGCVTEPPVQA